MEVIEKVITHKSRSDIFNIYAIGDIHAGSIECAENDIRRMVQRIKDDKFGYWIGMGDAVDAITKNDKRFDIEGLAPWVKKDNIVTSQKKWIKDLLSPIADKCLAFLEGNHEATIHTFHDEDITRNLCDDLKVPYGGYSCFIDVKFRRDSKDSIVKRGGQDYIIHAFHGAGAAQTEGARIMRLMRLVNDIQADIYLMGHLHCVATYTPDRLLLSNGRIKSRQLIAVMTGSWLKTYAQPKNGQQLNASYAERKGYKPSRIGAPVIHIEPDKDRFTVEG